MHSTSQFRVDECLIKISHCLSAVFAVIIMSAVSCTKTETLRENQRPKILLRTSLGDIVLEIYGDQAPTTASNFLKYIDENRYKSASFYRSVTLNNQPNNNVKIQVIQGGIGPIASGNRLPPIKHESTVQTKILHVDGTLSMARREPGTASSEFFICIDDQPELDLGGKRNKDGQGFAAFGRVVDGMKIVRTIHKQEVEGQKLSPPIMINDIFRVE